MAPGRPFGRASSGRRSGLGRPGGAPESTPVTRVGRRPASAAEAIDPERCLPSDGDPAAPGSACKEVRRPLANIRCLLAILLDSVLPAMEVRIDDGRIVIPKAVRDKLGMESGTSLEIRVAPDGGIGGAITLTPRASGPHSSRERSFGSTLGRLPTRASTWSSRFAPPGRNGPVRSPGWTDRRRVRGGARPAEPPPF